MSMPGLLSQLLVHSAQAKARETTENYSAVHWVINFICCVFDYRAIVNKVNASIHAFGISRTPIRNASVCCSFRHL